MRTSTAIILALCLSSVAPATTTGQSSDDVDQLLTRAERTNYEETSRYDDVIAFMETVAAASPVIHLTYFGYTFEGRPMPLAVVGRLADGEPRSVLETNRTRVFIQGNIHAGEVCGKEAAQMLLRELAHGEHAPWLDSLVILVAPIYNADGNERIALTNRGRQNGPVAGMGQRPNAQGYDLNRDHVKLDSPEARALVRIMNEYDPHVGIDLHTTNGTRHAFHITYSPPLHPNTSTAIDRLLRDEWLPYSQAHLLEETGWESFYYGNAPRRRDTGTMGWYTFDHRPRFNNNYLGLRNRFAILSEAYAYATFEERVVATRTFTAGAIEFAYANAARIRETVEHADREALIGQDLGIRVGPKAGDEVTILMGAVNEKRNPYSGATILERQDVKTEVAMIDFGAFESTEYERVPAAYIVPPDAQEVLDKLTDHGVRFEYVEESGEMPVEVFRIDSTTTSAREFQGHKERRLYGNYEESRRLVETGAAMVPLDQPLGRLIFHLLEPRSDDGFLNWNVLDRLLEGTDVYPIYRTH